LEESFLKENITKKLKIDYFLGLALFLSIIASNELTAEIPKKPTTFLVDFKFRLTTLVGILAKGVENKLPSCETC
jgi:hypothetical protein